MLNGFEMRANVMLKLGIRAWVGLLANAALKVTVEYFIQIVYLRIGWEIKHLNLCFVPTSRFKSKKMHPTTPLNRVHRTAVSLYYFVGH
jgi:hypothetical protein